MARKTDIRLRRSNTANAVPTSGNLNLGELALNTADGALYFKKSDNTIITAHDDTILHIDSDNNRVGIGTTSPSFRLHVDSGTNNTAGYFKSSNNKAVILVSDDDTNTYVSAENSTSSIGVNPGRHASNLNITSTGAVGIGTASPSTKLHVIHSSSEPVFIDAPSSTTAFIRSTTTAVGNSAKLGFAPSNSVAGVTLTATATEDFSDSTKRSASFTIGTRNNGNFADQFHITPAGLTGIGTTSPDVRLVVHGALRSTVTQTEGQHDLYRSHTSTSGQIGILSLTSVSTGNMGPGFGPQLSFRLRDTAGANNTAALIEAQRQASDTTSDLVFKLNAAQDEVIRLTSEGQLLIGTASSLHGSADLQIQGASGNYARIMLKDQDGTNQHAFLDKGGADLSFTSQNGTSHGGIALNTFNGTDTVTRLKVNASGSITFNNAYTFPTSDGTGGQVLKTDGSGNLTFQNDAGGGSANTVVDNDGDTKIQVEESTDEDIIRFDTAGTERMVINNAGNIGIGTSGPNESLHITRAGDAGLRLQNTSSSQQLRLDQNSIRTTTNSPLTIFTNGNASQLRLDQSTGNVGIGTSSPSAFLHVSKDNDNAGNQFAVADTEGVSPAVRTYTHNGDPAALILNHYYAVGGSSNEYMRYADFVANVGNGAGTTMRFITKNAANTFSVGLAQDNNGKVGIGTSDPVKTLEISYNDNTTNIGGNLSGGPSGPGLLIRNSNTTANIYANLDFRANNADGRIAYKFNSVNDGDFHFITDNNDSIDTKMIIKNAGNVGIGTTTPSAKLEILSDGSAAGGAEIRLQHANNNTNDVVSTVNFANNVGSVAMIQGGTTGANNTGYISFFTDNAGTSSEKVRIRHDGHVGIGTDNPLEPLSIHGSDPKIKLQDTDGTLQVGTITMAGGLMNIQSRDNTSHGSIKFQGYNGTDGLEFARFISSGNFGIGTSNPAEKLHVQGTGNESVKLRLRPGTTPGNVGAVTLGRTNGSGTAIVTDAVTGGVPIAGIAGIMLGSNTSGLSAVGIQTPNSSSGHIVFLPKGTEQVRITSTGQVGIGEDEPDEALVVRGGLYANNQDSGIAIQSGHHDGNHWKSAFKIKSDASGVMRTAIDTSTGQTSGQVNEAISINTSGNVGINKSSPTAARLVIREDSTYGLRLEDGSGHYFRVNTGGDTEIRGSVTLGDNTKHIATRQILARDTNGLTFKTSGGATTLFYTNAGDVTVQNNLTVSGNLTVDGTTTTINTATLDVEDKNITLNYHASNDTSSSANGAGITIQDAVNSTTDATILWDATNDEFDFSHAISVAGGASLTGDLSAANISVADDIKHTGDADTYISFDTNSQIFYSGGTRSIDLNPGSIVLNEGGGDQNFRVEGVGDANLIKADAGTARVGIGTDALTNKFHVSGNARIEGNLMAGGAAATNVPARPIHVKSAGDAAAIRIEDTTSSNLAYDLRSTHGTGLLFVDVTNGATRMLIGDDGKVGIGTTSPDGNLHIKSTNNVGDAILVLEADNDNNVEGDNPRIELRQDGNNVAGYLYVEGTGGQTATNTTDNFTVLESRGTLNSQGIQFVTGGRAPAQSGGAAAGSVKMTIKGNGNVGIGTNAPAYPLHVYNTGAKTVVIERASGSNAANLNEFSTHHALAILNRTSGSYLMFGGNSTRTDIQATDGAGTATAKNIHLNPHGGSVGIGTGQTAPDEKFHVEGGSIKIEAGAVSTTRGLIIAHTGQTGNQTKLEQLAGGNPHGLLHTTERALRISAGSGGGTGTSETLSFWTNANRAMTIDTSQNVGIGTTAPNQKLDVQGNIRIPPGQFLRAEDDDGTFRGAIKIAAPSTYNFEHYMASDGSNAAFFIENSTRNVGIGTESPDSRLHVVMPNLAGGNTGNGITVSDDGAQLKLEVRKGTGGVNANRRIALYEDGGTFPLYLQEEGGSTGIGVPRTTAIANPLVVAGPNSASQILVMNTSAAGGTAAQIQFKPSSNRSPGPFIRSTQRGGGASDGDLEFGDENGIIMTLNGSPGKVGIGTISPSSTLHIVGTNDAAGGITLTSSTSNSTQKVGRIKTQHYNTAEEPFTAILTNAQSTTNLINIGGASGAENAATNINFYVASNNTTLTGTKVMEIKPTTIDMYSGAGSNTVNIGRNSNEKLSLAVTDQFVTLTADQDSDSNATHTFILDRTFEGSGANNFEIRKAGTMQLRLDTNADATFAGEVYLSGSSTNYLSMHSGDMLRHNTGNGYIELGPANTGHAHIQTDRSNFYFNKRITVDEGIVQSYNEDLQLKRAQSDNHRLILGPTIFRGTNGNYGSFTQLGGFVLNTALEDTSTHSYIPGIMSNAFAGGSNRVSVTMTKDGSAQSFSNNMFNYGNTFASFTPGSASAVFVITITNYGGLTYGQNYGIQFSGNGFRAKSVKIEVSTDGTNYTTIINSTDNPNSVTSQYHGGGGTAVTHVRYTLTDCNNTGSGGLRIANVFGYNYGSNDQGYHHKLYSNNVAYSDTTFVDDKMVKFGDSGEFQLYHTSSGNSIISETGSGSLYLDGSNIYLRKSTASGEAMADFVADGAVTLYHNGSPKIATASDGVDITGRLDISSTATTSVIIGSGNTSLTLGTWSSGSTDLDSLTDGSAFGSLIQSGNNGHIVVGIKDNDINDSFSIVSGSGNFMTDTTYDKNIFKAKADGRIFLDSSGYFYSGNGTISSPSISFTSDQNTGIYRPAADQLGLVVGGSRKILISSSGTSIQNGNLSVNGQNITDVNQIDGTGGSGWLDFNMDADGVYPQSTTDNQTVLGSVTHMNFVADSNGNGTGGVFNFGYGVSSTDGGTFTKTMDLDRSGNLTIIGQLNATTKSFDIEHPTQEGKRLRYGVLEGPEHGVYVRGKSNSYIIELPEEWTGLVHEDSITVQLTAIGKAQELYVENIEDNKIYIGSERTIENYFYYVQAERKDVDKIETVYDDK